MTPDECDFAVIGGGILGLAVARELQARYPGARLCVLEAEGRIGFHQTGHSSGVIHAGIYYQPGSLKARLCVEGSRALAPSRDAYRLSTVRPRDLRETLAWPGTRRLVVKHWRAGLTEIRHAASCAAFLAAAARLVPSLRSARVTRAPAGIRAQALARDGSLVDDFVVHRTRAGDPRAQRALPRGDVVAGARPADRRRAGDPRRRLSVGAGDARQ